VQNQQTLVELTRGGHAYLKQKYIAQKKGEKRDRRAKEKGETQKKPEKGEGKKKNGDGEVEKTRALC